MELQFTEKMFLRLLLLISLAYSTATVGPKLKNFCYFTNWSNHLQNFDARFEIADINTTLCTHLIYAFAKINTQNMHLNPSQVDDDNGQLYNKQGRYYEFNNLKSKNPNLKTLLSIGGFAAGSGGFIQIVQSLETIKLFSRNVAVYLRDRQFDGIDIDWEWPGDIYKEKYTVLLKTMRDEFEKEATRKVSARLLITIAVAVGAKTINDSYNITEISKCVDYIHVMAYDFHGPWSHITGFSAPLYSRASDPQFNLQLSQMWAINRWLAGGAPADKLVMGLTGAATTFLLSNVTVDRGVGAKVTGPGRPGPFIQQKGHVPYYRVCELTDNGAVNTWDSEQCMAYAVLENQWIGYGNAKSMKEKVAFAYSKHLAGTMFWSLDLDDFHGLYCGKGRYPLLTAVYNAIIHPPTGHHQHTTRGPPSTTVDLRLHHRTNKNGINFFKEISAANIPTQSIVFLIITILIASGFS